jgi:hypothetical protein
MEFLKGAMVQLDEQYPDRGIQFGQREELAMSEPREYPALYQQYARLDGGFISSQQLQLVRHIKRFVSRSPTPFIPSAERGWYSSRAARIGEKTG